MLVTQDQFELIEEALTDLGNKYNTSLINRQCGRILARLEGIDSAEVTHSTTEVQSWTYTN